MGIEDRVTIQLRTAEPGPIEIAETWADVETRWARVLYTKQYVETRQGIRLRADYDVTFRDRLDLTYENTRFIWNDRILRPLEDSGPLNPGRSRVQWSRVLCRDEGAYGS